MDRNAQPRAPIVDAPVRPGGNPRAAPGQGRGPLRRRMEDVRNERSDTDIIREILEGNVDAFAFLVDRYQGYVAGIVVKKVHLTIADHNMGKIFNLNISEGKWFEKTDDRPDYYPIIISETLNKKLFPNTSSIGKNIQIGNYGYTVVGVVDHYKYKGDLSEPVDIIISLKWPKNIGINSWPKPKTDYFTAKAGTTIEDINSFLKNLILKYPEFNIQIIPLKAESDQAVCRVSMI